METWGEGNLDVHLDLIEDVLKKGRIKSTKNKRGFMKRLLVNG